MWPNNIIYFIVKSKTTPLLQTYQLVTALYDIDCFKYLNVNNQYMLFNNLRPWLFDLSI